MSKTARDVIAGCDDICIQDMGVIGELYAGRIIAALGAAGFVIAPKEPTPEMFKAADSIMGGGFQNSRSDREIYQAMIEAASQQPKP